MGKAETVSIRVGDMSGQRNAVTDLPTEASWGEALDGILGKLSLPKNPAGEEPVVWTGRLEREGRHLHASEVIGDALQEDDEVVIQRDIQAGSRCRTVRGA